jgi:secreted trypsin-like serine protease
MVSGLAAMGVSAVSLAVMAGAEPDSPSNRVDPNFASSAWASVGSVVVKGSPYSGVLITRRHVLTAAHVASGDPAHMEFVLNAGGDASQRIAVKSVHHHPEWKGFDPKRPNDDLAIIELAEPASAHIAIHPIAAGTFSAGLEFTAVGYGASGHGDVGAAIDASATVKRVGGNNADAFVSDESGSGRIEGYVFDFDGPGVRNVLGGEGLGNDVETTFARGDSGSPAFVRTRGGWALFGINTFIFNLPDGPAKQSTFGSGGGGVVVGAYREWIEQVLRETQR